MILVHTISGIIKPSSLFYGLFLAKTHGFFCVIKWQLTFIFTGQYGGPPQGIPGYMSGGMPPYGQAPPVVPQGYQGAPPRPPMGMRPPVMSPGGRY